LNVCPTSGISVQKILIKV